jgi:hypothetical protein
MLVCSITMETNNHCPAMSARQCSLSLVHFAEYYSTDMLPMTHRHKPLKRAVLWNGSAAPLVTGARSRSMRHGSHCDCNWGFAPLLVSCRIENGPLMILRFFQCSDTVSMGVDKVTSKTDRDLVAVHACLHMQSTKSGSACIPPRYTINYTRRWTLSSSRCSSSAISLMDHFEQKVV